MGILEQILGLVFLIIVAISQRFKNNKHINAIQTPLAFIVALQSALLGNWGYAVMATIAGTRIFILAMMPDEESAKPLRRKVAWASIFIGCGVVGGMGIFLSPLNFLPLFAMICGAFGSSMINNETLKAHTLYAFGSFFLVVYSIVFGNAYAAVSDTMSVFGHSQSIYDMRKKTS